MSSSILLSDSGRLQRIWLVGCGSMGGALLGRWLACGLSPRAVAVVDPSPSGVPEGFSGAVVADADAARRAMPDPTLIILAIKPQLLARVAPTLRPLAEPAPLVLSILAGVRTGSLAGFFPDAPIIRMMPNTPARIGRGVTALYPAGASGDDCDVADRLMRAAGAVEWLEDEGRFDAVTAVSGSGPAFLFRFTEALEAAAVAAGLDEEMARRLALETVAGAGELARQSSLSVAQLRQQVTSPAGTTEAGLDVLDGDGVLSRLLRSTIRAAAERSRELAGEADALARPAAPKAN